MLNCCSEYFFLISIFGFGVMLIFSIMSFSNCECLQIKQGQYISSGIILITNSLIYLTIAIIIKTRQISNIRKNALQRNL